LKSCSFDLQIASWLSRDLETWERS